MKLKKQELEYLVVHIFSANTEKTLRREAKRQELEYLILQFNSYGGQEDLKQKGENLNI